MFWIPENFSVQYFISSLNYILLLLETYLRKSLLQLAYMKGFMHEFNHPSQVRVGKTIWGLLIQSTFSWPHTPLITLVIKNGSQHMMKIPITVPNVFAAFFSFANFDIFLDMPTLGGKLASCWNIEPDLWWQFDIDRESLCEGDDFDASVLSFAMVLKDECEFFGPGRFEEFSLLLQSYRKCKMC